MHRILLSTTTKKPEAQPKIRKMFSHLDKDMYSRELVLIHSFFCLRSHCTGDRRVATTTRRTVRVPHSASSMMCISSLTENTCTCIISTHDSSDSGATENEIQNSSEAATRKTDTLNRDMYFPPRMWGLSLDKKINKPKAKRINRKKKEIHALVTQPTIASAPRS